MLSLPHSLQPQYITKFMSIVRLLPQLHGNMDPWAGKHKSLNITSINNLVITVD